MKIGGQNDQKSEKKLDIYSGVHRYLPAILAMRKPSSLACRRHIARLLCTCIAANLHWNRKLPNPAPAKGDQKPVLRHGTRISVFWGILVEITPVGRFQMRPMAGYFVLNHQKLSFMKTAHEHC
jgi:hypothetical protein